MNSLTNLNNIIDILELVAFGRINFNKEDFYRLFSRAERQLNKNYNKNLKERLYDCLGWYNSLERFEDI